MLPLAATATARALAIALCSFFTSLLVAGRDRAHLTIRARRGLTTPALVVQVTNAGRRPIGLNPLVHLLLADGSGVAPPTALVPRRAANPPAC